MESLASVAQTEKMPPDPPRLGGAFASYVRHRGEPDGKTNEAPSIPISQPSQSNCGGISSIFSIAKSVLPKQSEGEKRKYLNLMIPINIIMCYLQESQTLPLPLVLRLH